MKGKIGAILMAVLLLVYLVLVGQRAVLLMVSGQVAGVIMGIALIVLPLIAVWAIWREIMFGVHTEKLVHILESEDALPVDDLPHRASGRPHRDAADAEFPRYKAEVEAQPDSWRAWFRLGLAYDASGDRKRARHALREAFKLYRDSSHSIA